MTELFLHEGNVGEFNAALREHPDLRAFAAAFHQAGLIDGLRGARLRPADAPRPENLQGVTPVLSYEAEKRLADLWWQRSQEGAQA